MNTSTKLRLAPLKRPSGAFAMLAIDQRESMRAMFAEGRSGPVADAVVADFKLAALRTLTPFASAVLLDRQFAWARAVAERAIAPDCALIAAADRFIPGGDELIADVEIDEAVVPEQVRADGAVALKLLILWRPDETAGKRIALVRDFVARCRAVDAVSIIEPVSRRPRDGRAWDHDQGILAAARELGGLGADLYKAEVPLHGEGSESEVRSRCAELTRAIPSPWVVLSSGVSPDRFPTAVEWACREGASGFLAGRAVWRDAIASADPQTALRKDSAPRLQRLCAAVDRVVSQ